MGNRAYNNDGKIKDSSHSVIESKTDVPMKGESARSLLSIHLHLLLVLKSTEKYEQVYTRYKRFKRGRDFLPRRD